MDPFEVAARQDHVKAQEAAGKVADSMDVRRALMRRFHAGEITLEDAQAQLKAIQRGAKKNGQTTRAKAWSGRS